MNLQLKVFINYIWFCLHIIPSVCHTASAMNTFKFRLTHEGIYFILRYLVYAFSLFSNRSNNQ